MTNQTAYHGIPGMSTKLIRENMAAKFAGDYPSFASCLAVFFPAVTDPLAGSNLSGDLKDPQHSIPPGTIFAVLATTTIFCVQVLFAGGSCEREALVSDSLIVSKLAWPAKELVLLGMCMSTLGAGLQSLAGAPRLLAAIGREGIIPPLRFFAPPSGEEPRRAVIICAILGTSAVMMKKLEVVAPFITMWFLTSYGIINGACAFLDYERSPSFRPTFKYYNWRLSVLGSIQCFGMMLFCAPKWYHALIACFVSVGLYFYIQRQVHIDERSVYDNGIKCSLPDDEADQTLRGHVDWRSGRRFTAARQSLLALKQGDMDFKYWRPFVLFLAKISEENGDYVPQQGMLHLVCQMMKRGKGLSIIAGVVESDFKGDFKQKMTLVENARLLMEKAMTDRGIEGFPEIIPARTRYEGYKTLVTGKGLGYLRPNTVMLGWPNNIRGSTNICNEPYMMHI